MSRFAKPAHKRASQLLGYTLTLGDFDAWIGFAFLIRIILSPAERAALAYAALRSLDDDDAMATAETAIFDVEHGRAA
ncbi:hypothetical protein P1J78_04170 [Psychromarinibacter sp. C21-152]|uniref:Uncharacterized protein n=1 Tax=Psychromarinibacter sediminicola TaxID=3033385 RepID=A0AAE3NPW3_9RHOB|nr:hypothetical protein [Psychromarinibacter sediminicola]MDF0599921.1 hypothetical protein [Psychromarinibacter sediminicola]